MMADISPTPITDALAGTQPSARTPEEVASLLRRPFHHSVYREKPVDGKMVKYVPIDAVVERLCKAAPAWHWEVTRIEVINLPLKRKGKMVNTPVVHVTGKLTIPGLGSRGGIGTAPAENDKNVAKIAESDAIKRAASEFLVPGGR